MAKKSAIVVGIAAAVVAVSMAYGAIANPGGESEVEEPGSEVWNFRFRSHALSESDIYFLTFSYILL